MHSIRLRSGDGGGTVRWGIRCLNLELRAYVYSTQRISRPALTNHNRLISDQGLLQATITDCAVFMVPSRTLGVPAGPVERPYPRPRAGLHHLYTLTVLFCTCICVPRVNTPCVQCSVSWHEKASTFAEIISDCERCIDYLNPSLRRY